MTRCWNGCAMRCTPATPTNGASMRRRSGAIRPNTSGFSDRINAMYVDKLDGLVDARLLRARCRTSGARSRIAACARSNGTRKADKSYMDEGVQLLELARNAQRLFERQEPREKRRLLNFVLSNCTWEDGEVVATFRQPFDLLAETTVSAARVAADGGAQFA